MKLSICQKTQQNTHTLKGEVEAAIQGRWIITLHTLRSNIFLILPGDTDANVTWHKTCITLLKKKEFVYFLPVEVYLC